MTPAPIDRGEPSAGAPALPESIGRYRILGRLGKGGMGTVFEAEQDSPRRIVALKVVHAGVMSDEMRRRFELEAQVLGHLQHPCIAQIHEAGMFETSDGAQPFFAMELIRGVPLTRHAEERQLDTRARLALLARICDGVQHAHQRGVIHRDLKPENILVDSEGEPKILDFGLARATEADIQTATLHTDMGRIMGTVPYMSPEQASGDPAAIDARSDIYALGVVAYELLSGEMPYAADGALVFEALRVVREEEPRPLSSINRTLRGDVETIVGKALAKEPDRRYPYASALADDIRRFLDDEPIAARRPSKSYQLRKFARRNRALVLGLLAVFVALVLGLFGTARGYFAAERRRVEADTARGAAEVSALRARKSSDFLRAILGGIDPAQAQGQDTTLLRRILADTEVRIEEELAGLPLVEAEIRDTIGRTYCAIDDFPAAEPHLRRAWELYREHTDPRGRTCLLAWSQLGVAARGLQRFEEAEAILTAASEAAHEHLGSTHVVTLSIDHDLAIYEFDTDQIEQSMRRLGDVLARMRENPEATAADYINLGLTHSTLLLRVGDIQEAQRSLTELLAYARTELGDEHPRTLKVGINHAAVQMSAGRYDLAAGLYRECVAQCLRVYGPGDKSTLTAQRALARVLRRQGQLAESEALLLQVAEASATAQGPDSTDLHRTRAEQGATWRKQGRYAEAEAALLEALDGHTRNLGADHRDTRDMRCSLGGLYRQARREAEAEPLLREALASFDTDPGHEPGARLGALGDLALVLLQMGRLDEALEMQREAHRGYVDLLGPHHPDALVALSNVGLILLTRGDNAEAAQLYAGMLDEYREVLGARHSNVVNTAYNASRAFEALGQSVEALPYLLEAAQGLHENRGPTNGPARIARGQLLTLFEGVDQPEAEEPWRRIELEQARRGRHSAPTLADPLGALAYTLVRQERGEEAIGLLEEALELSLDLDADDPRLAWLQALYGAALLYEGRRDEAAMLLPRAVEQLAEEPRQRRLDAQAWLEQL